MSALGRSLDSVALQGRDHRTLLVLRAASVPGFLVAAWAAGGGVPVWVLVAATLLAAGCALEADGHLALVTSAFLCWFWLAYVRQAGTAWVVVAALALLTLHLASAAATTTPGDADFDRTARDRWLRRAALGGGAALTCWVVVRAVLALDAPGSLVATASTLLLLVLGAWWLRRQSSPTA